MSIGNRLILRMVIVIELCGPCIGKIGRGALGEFNDSLMQHLASEVRGGKRVENGHIKNIVLPHCIISAYS